MFDSLTTSQKGAVAECAIALAAMKRGLGVMKPLSEGLRYDLVFDAGGRLLRIQCKCAVRRANVLVVPCFSARRTSGGFAKKPYDESEIDVVVAHSTELDRCYALPRFVFAGRSYVQLRTAPARNNQRAGVRWAADFEFDALDWRAVEGP
ncbi:MAG: hypothetical protein IT201_10485 [Thermoleophilia bacterium]|nr:hypothetical protein [Thermoleophilia bacterium]